MSKCGIDVLYPFWQASMNLNDGTTLQTLATFVKAEHEIAV